MVLFLEQREQGKRIEAKTVLIAKSVTRAAYLCFVSCLLGPGIMTRIYCCLLGINQANSLVLTHGSSSKFLWNFESLFF